MEEKTFARIGREEALNLLYEGSGYKRGSDAQVFAAAGRDQIVGASRLLSEGIDFDLVYFPLKHLGFKTVVAVTGALYAQLARPRTLSVSLGISAKLDFPQIQEFWSGVVSAAHQYHYEGLDLKLQPSRNGFLIAAAATGTLPALDASRRPKPQSKDLLCVSGSLGAAYLGLQVLEREKMRFEAGSTQGSEEMERYKMLVGAYLKPELQGELPALLASSDIYPSAGCLVDKGLAAAMQDLAAGTGLGVKVYADKIPFEGGSFELGKSLDFDPVSAAMNGGEDFRLLFTVPILKLEKFRRDFQTFDIIGHLALPEAGCVLVEPTGAELPVTTP
ncbi:MAG: hypothetical protein IJS62_08870 [Bacteroidales bacterium]|nr:hypothetical protein [Treponema sp.]MBQ7269938.1 hypothetical protein [Bacteroidales bacterium]